MTIKMYPYSVPTICDRDLQKFHFECMDTLGANIWKPILAGHGENAALPLPLLQIAAITVGLPQHHLDLCRWTAAVLLLQYRSQFAVASRVPPHATMHSIFYPTLSFPPCLPPQRPFTSSSSPSLKSPARETGDPCE
jgi:hypothetical protein